MGRSSSRSLFEMYTKRPWASRSTSRTRSRIASFIRRPVWIRVASTARSRAHSDDVMIAFSTFRVRAETQPSGQPEWVNLLEQISLEPSTA
jgi:hypothetical protein